jgi:signal transduction histidine kinase
LHPAFLGANRAYGNFRNPDISMLMPFILFLVVQSSTVTGIQFFVKKYLAARDTSAHLNMVATKMLLLNHKLQELVKDRGEESVRQDRLRFTKDLHDGCGYAFTNIIAVADAAVSHGKIETAQVQEIFQRIHRLAAEGLRETRTILHMIREIQEPYTKSIDTVYQLKMIFEEVTNIKISIEWGNIKPDYGTVVNQIIMRIVQEALTNSIRHGQASRIVIQFWEADGQLSMTVTDNGLGSSEIVKGIGLAGMEERLDSVGGILTISSPEEGGFRVKVAIPVGPKEMSC